MDMKTIDWDEQVKLAEAIAREAHKDQVRNKGLDAGKPYIIHPERMANKAEEPIIKACAWLHDTVEDANLTFDDLKAKGVCQEVLDILDYVTKKPNENYHDFISRIVWDFDAMKLKKLDLEDNLMGCPEGSMKDKYRLAKWIIEEYMRRWILTK